MYNTTSQLDVSREDVISTVESDFDNDLDAFEAARNVHKQGRFFEFTNPQTEARFTEYRFGPVGLYFPCGVAFVVSFMTLSSNIARFDADLLRTSPVQWFFNDPSWQKEKYAVTMYFFYISGLIILLMPCIALAYNFFVRKNAAVAGKYLAAFGVALCACQASCHSVMDYRYEVFCEEQKFSLFLRDDKVVSHCDDFVEPYVPISFMASFIIMPRFKEMVLMILIFLPFPFYLRYPIGYDYLFRASDAVWFFTMIFFIVGFAAYEFVLRRQFILHEMVEQEMEETKRARNVVSRLLDAMLPASVLKRLIANESISDSGVVSTVFSDVAGFTAWCSSQKAQLVVAALNVMYTHFDGGLQRYGIEKVKTIGDAYWAICGLPEPNPNHIMHICAFAKYMLRCVQQMGEDNKRHTLKIRIGVHTGNVCGGLVGTHQSSYDMFGTTNEVAELMEQRAPVGGILMSEPSYMVVKARQKQAVPPHDDSQCIVVLQDEAIETVQGKMATYVLKRFDWLPEEPLHTEIGGSTSASVVAVAAEQPLSPHMRTKDDFVAELQTTTVLSVFTDETTEEKVQQRESHSPEEQLAKQRAKLSAATHKLHHTFDDEEVEAEFQQFMRAVFPNKLRAVNSMLGGMIFVIYVVMLAEGHSHPWYTHFMIVVDLLLTAGLIFVAERASLHPIAGLCAFYAECNLLLFALFSANRSLVSVDLVYLPFYFAVLYPTLGYVGGNAPYLYICAANILFLLSPTLIIMAAVKSIFVAHFHIPAVFAALWIIAVRRSEMGQRQQFIDRKIADLALQQTQTQHEKVSELLSRMVPRFIVDELTIWVCGPRDTMIADNFPLVGILFIRVPALHEQFSDSTIDPLTVMGLIGNYATVCDSVLNEFPDCTKLKIVGDVLLFASGLVGAQNGGANGNNDAMNPLSKKNIDACTVETLSCSSDHSTIGSDDGNLYAQHLLGLAHLATTLQFKVEDHFDGAKISAGMHCGNATAGIIGNDRLIYDVFGDTVNTASRVMSTSGAGVWASVKFSTKLSSLGSHGLHFGKRTERQMKGKGTMHVVSVRNLPTSPMSV